MRSEPRRVALEGREVAALLRAHDVAAGPADVQSVLDETGGDPVSTVAAIRRRAARGAGSPGDAPLGAEAIAGLPLLSPGLVDAVLGPGAWRRLTGAGAALQPRSDGWYVPASAPRASMAPVEHRAVAARWYAEHGQLAVAVRWLHSLGDHERLTDVLAETLTAGDRSRRWAELDEMEPGELETVARGWSDEMVRRRPEALLALVRALEFGMQARTRGAWLARLDALVDQAHPARAAVDAELVRELARQGKVEEVHSRAERLLPHADEVSRARLLMADSLVDLLHQQAEAAERGRVKLQEAAALLRVNGEREWEADAWLTLAGGADMHAGRVGLAIEHLERALALTASGTQLRGRVLTFLADYLSYAGRYAEAQAALDEVQELVEGRQDVALTAYTAWSAASVAARRGDLTTAREQLAVVEAHRGEWYQLPAGVAFHAEAAEMLASLGEYDAARTHLRAGRAHSAAADYGSSFLMAELVLAARDGDPAEASDLAGRAVRTALTSWRITLLEAWASERAGNHERARELADDALRQAEALGHPEIVEAVEPELSIWARGPDGAGRRPAPLGRRRVRLLGPARVEDAAGTRRPRRGDETTLLTAVAARGDVDVASMLDLLWGGEDDVVARRRLRNTLNRLRGSVGEVVVRRGNRLTLAPDVEVDVHLVLHAAHARHTVPELGVEASRRALALVEGELQGSAPDLALDELRGELALAVGRLADRVSDAATTAGELGEAARWLTLARRLDRYDEPRSVRLVMVLRALGRDAEAEDVLRDAVLACAELGVLPAPELTRLAGD